MLSNQQSFQSSVSAARDQDSRSNVFTTRKEYGNTFDKAKNIGTLKRGKSYRFEGDVGRRDLDFFKFTVKRGTNFTAQLSSDSDNDEDIAISILDRRKRTVNNNGFLFRNVEAGATSTLSVSGLAPGTYYIRLQSQRGQGEDYSLNLTTTTGAATFPNAVKLGDLRVGESVSRVGAVGDEDVDYYQFSLNGTSRLTGVFSNESRDESIAFSILDESGRTVKTRTGKFLFVNVEPREFGNLLAPTLAAGTYYLRAQSQEGDDEDYSLRLTRSASTSPI